MAGFNSLTIPEINIPDVEVAPYAETLARRFHGGQFYDDSTDLDFVDYHLLPGVQAIRSLGGDDFDEATFWLHDLVEDTDTTLEDLEHLGIPSEVVYSVDCLTIRDGETDEENLERISEDPRASRVKYVDAIRNLESTLSRKDELGSDAYINCVYKYTGKVIYLAELNKFSPDMSTDWAEFMREGAAHAEKILMAHLLENALIYQDDFSGTRR